LPSRARLRGCRAVAGIGLQAGVDRVADPPLEAAQRFLVGLALGDLALVVGAAVAVSVPDLGDGGDVDRVLPHCREHSAHLTVARGLPRCEDRRVDIPPRTATDRYLSRRGQQLDIVFDIDLGELVEGHHVVARGIMLARPVRVPRADPAREGRVALAASPADRGHDAGIIIRRAGAAHPDAVDLVLTEPALHYEFVPGLTETQAHGPGGSGRDWMLSASDDLGSKYSDNNLGAFDGRSGGAATHGYQDIGGQIPPHARRLTIRVQPAEGWTPPGPWHREIVIDLREHRLAS
jgi:hypothetical protein